MNSSLAANDGHEVEGGLIVKRQFEDVMLSGSVSAGYGWYDGDRDAGFPTLGLIASSDQDVVYGSSHGRVSRDFELGANRYIRPLLDLGVTQVRRKGFKEEGAGAANLDIDSEDDTFWTLQAAVDFGGEFERDNGTLIRPHARHGATQHLNDNQGQTSGSLQSAAKGVAPFRIDAKSERTLADLSLGFDLIKKDGTSLRLDYVPF